MNLYVTFSECAPMLPIESFEVDVPCILGNNNHYFKKTELEKYKWENHENKTFNFDFSKGDTTYILYDSLKIQLLHLFFDKLVSK